MTGKSPWFRCFPDQFLVGTAQLSDELFAAYTRLFMLMYSTARPLPLDGQWLKPILGKRPQDCLRIVAALAALGKLTVEGGLIHNKRTVYELRRQGKWQRNDPANDNDMPGEMPQEMNGKWAGQNGEKHNKSYVRARDRMRPDNHEDEVKKKEGGGEPSPTSSAAAAPQRFKVSATRSARAAALAVEAATLPALDVGEEPASNPALVAQLIEAGTKRPKTLADIANSWKEEEPDAND